MQPAHASALVADDVGEQVIDAGAAPPSPSRRKPRRDVVEDRRVADPDADARAIGLEAEARRPPEAVDLLQSGRRPAQAGNARGAHRQEDRTLLAALATPCVAAHTGL